MAIQARSLFASKLFASSLHSGAINQNPAVFNFNSVMTTLPQPLVAMNATFTRASVKNVLQNGALVQLASGAFGTEYDSVTGLYGYVPEPAATNLCLYNRNYPNAWWATGGATPTSVSYPALDGAATCYKLIEDAGVSGHQLVSGFAPTAATTYTVSFYAKNLSGTRGLMITGAGINGAGEAACFNLVAGTVALAGTSTVVKAAMITPAGSWYKCAVTLLAANTSVINIALTNSYAAGANASYAGDGTSGIYLDYVQIETGSRATSPIYTTAATATRAAETLSVPLANIPGFSSAGYTLFGDCRVDYATSSLRYLTAVDDGTTANFAQIAASAAETFSTLVTSGSAIQAATTETAIALTRKKIAYSVAANSFLRAVGGSTGTADVSGSVPVSPTTFRLGSNSAGAQFNGFIFRAGLVPVALTQAQINGMTL